MHRLAVAVIPKMEASRGGGCSQSEDVQVTVRRQLLGCWQRRSDRGGGEDERRQTEALGRYKAKVDNEGAAGLLKTIGVR